MPHQESEEDNATPLQPCSIKQMKAICNDQNGQAFPDAEAKPYLMQMSRKNSTSRRARCATTIATTLTELTRSRPQDRMAAAHALLEDAEIEHEIYTEIKKCMLFHYLNTLGDKI